MTVLLTGGLGYIGSHICVELLQAGKRVVIIDNLVNSSRETLAGIKKIAPCAADNLSFIADDLVTSTQLAEIFAAHGVKAVIHLAGLKAVAESIEKPLEYYRNNVIATMHLLAAMEAAGCRQLLFSSSATVYGSQDSPINESKSTGRELGSPYGKSKYFIEEILKDYHLAPPEWSMVLLRYFNPVGAHPSGIIGEAPLGIPNNLMPIIARVAYAHNLGAQNASAGEPPFLSVYGDDYPSPDGTCIRDFIHVCDLAEAHLCALQAAKGFHIYNVGTGKGTSVLEILNAYQRYNKLTIPYRLAPRRPGDSAVTFCSADKMLRDFGWQAKKSLEDIVVDSWRWTRTSFSQSVRSAQGA
jgi:UDP-glucose 4-epimerase